MKSIQKKSHSLKSIIWWTVIVCLLISPWTVSQWIRDRLVPRRNLATWDLTQLTQRWAGASSDDVERMIVDSTGDIYIGGSTFSSGQKDALIVKLNSTYSQQWAKTYGGSLDEDVGDIAVATDGVYVVGTTQTTAMTNGGRDIYILKLSKSNGAKTFAMLYGSTSDEYVTAVQVDGGYIYVGGYSTSTGWKSSGFDYIMFKLDASTGAKQWSKYLGNSSNDRLTDLIISSSVIYAIGYGDIGVGGDDLLLIKAGTSDGSYSSYSYFGGTNSEISARLKADSSGYLYISATSSSIGLTNGFYDWVIIKVNASSNEITWGVYIGSAASDEYLEDILISSDESYVYCIGYTDQTETTNFGSYDILMTKSSASDGALDFVVVLGGSINDYGRTMYVLSSGKYLISGSTISTSLSASGTQDILLLEIDSKGRNQCSSLSRADITSDIASVEFDKSQYDFTNAVPNTGTISSDVRTASGDTLSSSSTSFDDIWSNYSPIIAEEGQSDLTAYESIEFSTTLQEFWDSTGNSLTYTLTQSDGSDIQSWLTFTASTRGLAGTPGSTDGGDYTYNYTATDEGGSSGVVQFSLYVNTAPTLVTSLVDQDARTYSTFSYTFSYDTFTDADDDVITYSASGLSSWATFNSASLTISGTPSLTDEGEDTIEIVATDTNSLSSSTTFKLSVTGNVYPVISNEIPDQTAPKDVAYSYTFAENTFTDANSDTLTYTISGNPSYIIFDSSTRTISGTPTEDWAYNISITANDGYSGTVTDIFELTLGSGIPNTSPSVQGTVSDSTAYTSVQFSKTISSTLFTDADGDALSYSSTLNDGSSLPSWLVFDSSKLKYGGQPEIDDIDTYTVKITADDSNGGTASTNFQITVKAYSSSAAAIAIIVIVVIVVLILIAILVTAMLLIRKRKIDRQREIESDSSSDDEDEEIIDKTGALTQFLANTHKLEGNKFIPNPETGAIYQKKSLDSLFTPLESVKKFFKTKYGFDYDEDKGMFTTTQSNFAKFNSGKKNKSNKEIDPLNMETGLIHENPNETDEDEKVESPIELRDAKQKIVVKAQTRKSGKSPSKKTSKKMNKVGVSDSPPMKQSKSSKGLNLSQSKSPKTTKNKPNKTLSKKSKSKRPKSSSPKGKSGKKSKLDGKSERSPSPTAKSVKSGKAKSVKSAKAKSVKSNKSKKK